MKAVIVGGGIIGLATGRLLTRQWPDAEITVLEKEPAPATHQTGHNSGVVHAGIYYAPGSLKARLCRRGVELLREYCEERELPYEECGKVVVATAAKELPRLRRLAERAEENGVPGLRWLESADLARVEPHAVGVAALHSPHTAITDYPAIAASLAAEIVAGGGEIRFGAEVSRLRRHGAVSVELGDGTELQADRVIVCAGLQADRLARRSGEPKGPRIVPFRGEYWRLREERTELVRGLIYPVPDPTLPFLGVHLTREIGGGVTIGPNAVLALAREGYRRRQVKAADLGEIFAWPGTWRLMAKHWRAGATEMRRSASKRFFIGEARRYVPELRPSDAIRSRAGVRAQAVDADGGMVDDFRLGGDDRVVWVRNAPSPAATSSLAIAEVLFERLQA
jgi:L-2-hydroxyglutarate oxidase LhgO